MTIKNLNNWRKFISNIFDRLLWNYSS